MPTTLVKSQRISPCCCCFASARNRIEIQNVPMWTSLLTFIINNQMTLQVIFLTCHAKISTSLCMNTLALAHKQKDLFHFVCLSKSSKCKTRFFKFSFFHSAFVCLFVFVSHFLFSFLCFLCTSSDRVCSSLNWIVGDWDHMCVRIIFCMSSNCAKLHVHIWKCVCCGVVAGVCFFFLFYFSETSFSCCEFDVFVCTESIGNTHCKSHYTFDHRN